jgi:hypothetical protein
LPTIPNEHYTVNVGRFVLRAGLIATGAPIPSLQDDLQLLANPPLVALLRNGLLGDEQAMPSFLGYL